MEATSMQGDMVFELLKRVDGPTLARAGCSSSLFRNATMDEQLWEQLCSQLWPSSKNPEARSLIQSLGGFRKFYCNCFPMVIDERSFDAPGCGSRFRGREPFFPGFCDDDELQSLSLSDFVSLVDVHYRDKVVYSKITWGMPDAGDFSGWFSNCPFSLNVISSFESGEHSDGQVTISMADGLPEITSLESERKFGKLWNEIWNNFRLSWILVNRREKQAVNLASWKPLGGRKHWPTEKDFVIKFGCVLPAHEILSFHAVQCVLEMRCKISFVGGDGDSGSHASLRITELSLQLEDIDGAHVNGRNSLLILKRAPSCQRTTNFLRILESYHLFLKAKNLFMEKKIRGEGLIDTLSAVGGILAVAGFCFLFF